MAVKYENERLLILAPHADDAEFGVGGWLARRAELGMGDTRVVVAACGDYVRSDGKPVTEKQRLDEAKRALKHIDVTDVWFGGWFYENKALAAEYSHVVGEVEDAIERFKPTELFIPLPSFNQDHRVIHDASMTALRPGMFPDIRDVFAYEYPGSFHGNHLPTTGKTYVKLEQHHVDLKMHALWEHRSQFEGRKVAVCPDAAYTLLRQRGAEIGCEFAELLYSIRTIY